MTCQRYYLIECQHVAVLSARISPLGAGAFRSTFTCEPKSSCRTQDPRRPTYSDVKVPVSMEVWLGLVTSRVGGGGRLGMKASRPVVWYVVGLVRPAKTETNEKVHAALTRDCQ